MSKPWITEPRDRRSKKYRAKHAELCAELGKPRPRTEDELHAAVVEYLAVALPKSALCWHTPNEGKRGFVAQAALKWNGTLKGFPDLCILYRGVLTCIELKRPGGKTTAHQKACHTLLNQAGASVFTCYSVDEVENVLVESGMNVCVRLAA